MFPYVSLGNISNTRKSVSSEKWLKSKCFYSFSIFRQGGPVNNGNWTEWSTVWAGIVRVIWNHKYDFRPNCTTGGQLPFLLYPFWNCSNNGLAQFRYFIDAVLRRFEITFILFFLRGKQTFQNLPHDTLCLSFSCNLVGYFKQALKSDRLFFFGVASSLAGKKMRFKAKNGAIRE